MHKSKFIWGGIVVLALIFAGFLWYQSYARKGKTITNPAATENGANEDGSFDNMTDDTEAADQAAMAQDETDYNALCENGEWLKIADQSGEVSSAVGKLRKVYPDDVPSEFKNYLYYIEGTENLGITGSDLFKLDYFEDREVEVQGVKNAAKKEISVSQVKCTGIETDKSVLDRRKSLMDWLVRNINSVAPQKAKYQRWTVDIVDFVDESNAYVEYYDTVEDDENSDVEDDTSRRMLVEIGPSGAGYNAKVLAYWEMGEDDFVLKTGKDKFEDADTIASYQYDPEEKIWERID
ncbi:MAG: hypothetical protein A2359_00300 [Candidatus Moranbacteria bacterium RIFOXYB1_FULL_43_19]|nr:MAG: hypothetical protein A2359_00300 [Candidatus Moranbacteria bacterium RIFOXYB1_FULL_43_19]OGI28101.1 MAG: hypothetical protein A2184_04370 [Candidatus Moranbacteria bacterium RIFOXYA1_FULL_44_7]OGI33745.1 MAG: hypothetical protein A2420_04935 [Candidatus Moranbacteria bacterium RIFOXYC1_FULL_44_13]OGI38032.1 MAG: hypothetical protein A2612_00485 [Candidatus Moranbacteria bacterium RIFOXYD1_FULL_44_12]